MVDDRHPRRRLVPALSEVGRLHALLRVFECVEVAGRERCRSLDANRHASVLDNEEHLPDAVVDVPDEITDRRLVHAEGQFARRRSSNPHLVLEVRGDNPVSFAERAIFVDVVLGDDEHRQALGPGLGPRTTCKNEVDDVLVVVVLGRRDEPLNALDVPHIAVDVGGLRDARADVGAGVGFGEHHRGAPVPFDHRPGRIARPVPACRRLR